MESSMTLLSAHIQFLVRNFAFLRPRLRLDYLRCFPDWVWKDLYA